MVRGLDDMHGSHGRCMTPSHILHVARSLLGLCIQRNLRLGPAFGCTFTWPVSRQ